MLITSLDNKKIKKYALLKNSRERKKEKLFLVEGMHLCQEAYKNNLLVDIIALENTDISFKYSKEITYVTQNILKKLSCLTTPSNIIGVCKMEDSNQIIGNHILILDDIQDPGNLGTILRTIDSVRTFSSNCV
jgi:TrmH family RNA methyltransferase